MAWRTKKITAVEGDQQKEIEIIDTDGNGMPVWVHDADGKTVGVDAKYLFEKVADLIEKEKSLKASKKEIEQQFATVRSQIEDIGDLEKAREALKTVANLDGKKMVDAKKVDELRDQLKTEYDKAREKMDADHKALVEKLQSDLDSSQKHIHRLTISNAFRGSKVLNGPDSQVTVPVEMAEEYWGKYFKPEEHNGQLVPVAYIGQDRIFNPARPGEPASFDEAIMEIIEKHCPFKERIKKGAGQSGGGSGGGANAGHSGGNGGGNGGDPYAHVKTMKDFRSNTERIAYIRDRGLDAYKKVVDTTRDAERMAKAGK